MWSPFFLGKDIQYSTGCSACVVIGEEVGSGACRVSEGIQPCMVNGGWLVMTLVRKINLFPASLVSLAIICSACGKYIAIYHPCSALVFLCGKSTNIQASIYLPCRSLILLAAGSQCLSPGPSPPPALISRCLQ